MTARATYGKTLAFRTDDGEVLLVEGNGAPGTRNFLADRENWLSRECGRRSLPMACYKAADLPRVCRPLITVLAGIGVCKDLEFNPGVLHLNFGRALDMHVFIHETPGDRVTARWWDTYTIACKLCNIEPLFPSARELWDWYTKAVQLL
jgi:hypothetical protein